MTFPSSGAKKLAIDRESFQKLLAAAYALQENKNVLQAGNSGQDSAAVFSEIAALRSQILPQIDSAELKAVNPKQAQAKAKTAAEAAALVAHCLRRLTKADGASVCLIVDGYLRPTTCSGRAAKVSGGSVASNSLVATERLRNGRAFQSANACSDIRLGPSLCVELQIGSLLAFPIERQNEIAGLIEVRWTKADAFSDGDERICQLMADLMGEVLEGVAPEISDSVPAPHPNASSEMVKPPSPATHQTEAGVSSLETVGGRACRICGKPLNDDVNFCGSCGMLSPSPDNGMQGKWASMWFMQQAQKSVASENGSERMWPLHEAKTDTGSYSGAPSLENPTDNSENAATDEAAEGIVAGKRSSRSVLSVLKARFRVRAVGQ